MASSYRHWSEKYREGHRVLQHIRVFAMCGTVRDDSTVDIKVQFLPEDVVAMVSFLPLRRGALDYRAEMRR